MAYEIVLTARARKPKSAHLADFAVMYYLETVDSCRDLPVGADFKEVVLRTDTQSGAPSASTNLTALSGDATGSTKGEHRHTPEELLALVLDSLDDSKATEVVSIELAGKSPIADHMVIATGTSTRQVVTIAEKLVEKLKQDAKIVPRLEGVAQGDWALIDAGDIIIHIFRPEVREFYNLERMWTDIPGPALNG